MLIFRCFLISVNNRLFSGNLENFHGARFLNYSLRYVVSCALSCAWSIRAINIYIDTHPAFFLLRNCLSMPRLLLKLKSSPCYRLHSELTQFAETLRQAASTVFNVNFDDTWWQRSSIPVAQGGLGLSSAVSLGNCEHA